MDFSPSPLSSMARGGVIRPSQVLGRCATCGTNATEKRSNHDVIVNGQPETSKRAFIAVGIGVGLSAHPAQVRE